MLTYSAGIFDPDTRADAFAEALTALGADPDDFETEIGSTVDLLDELIAAAPDTTSGQIDALTQYVAILAAGGIVTGKNLAAISGLTDVADIATANATDTASAVALANATKTTVNTLLGRLRTAGILTT